MSNRFWNQDFNKGIFISKPIKGPILYIQEILIASRDTSLLELFYIPTCFSSYQSLKALAQVNSNDSHAGARNRRKAGVKIRRNPLLNFLSMIQKYDYVAIQ